MWKVNKYLSGDEVNGLPAGLRFLVDAEKVVDYKAQLEQKYGIEIVRLKPDKSIPLCVKEYGVPFLSKYVSEQMMRLQKHNFQ